MFSCENHLSKKIKTFFPKTFFMCRAKWIGFFLLTSEFFFYSFWHTENKIPCVKQREKNYSDVKFVLLSHAKKDFTCENVFSWLDTWKNSSPVGKKKIFTHGKNIFVSRVKKCLLWSKWELQNETLFFFFTPLTQHIFSLDTWKYFFHVWNRVNFFFHSGKLIFRA